MRAVLLSGATRATRLALTKEIRAKAAARRPRNRAPLVHSRHRHWSSLVVAAAASTSGDSLPQQRKEEAPGAAAAPSSLSSARAAARFTAAYIILAGFAAIAAPLAVGAALFGGNVASVAASSSASAAAVSAFPLVSSWLIRVLGVLAVTFGVYYAGAASGKGERGFYESTVAGRVALAASFVLLALFGLDDNGSGAVAVKVAAAVTAQKTPRFGLLLLAAANAVGAASMALALRRDDGRKK